MREDEEGFSICAAEDKLQWTLGHVDLRDLLAGRRVDEDLAIGHIDITFLSTATLSPPRCAKALRSVSVPSGFTLAL